MKTENGDLEVSNPPDGFPDAIAYVLINERVAKRYFDSAGAMLTKRQALALIRALQARLNA